MSPEDEHTERTAELARLVQVAPPLFSPEVKATLYRMSDGMREHEQRWIDLVFEQEPEALSPDIQQSVVSPVPSGVGLLMIDEGHLIVGDRSYSVTDTPVTALSSIINGEPVITGTFTTTFFDKALYDGIVAGGAQLAQDMVVLMKTVRWQDELELDDEVFDQVVASFKSQAELYMRDKDEPDVDDTTHAENCLSWVLMPIRLALAQAHAAQKEDPTP